MTPTWIAGATRAFGIVRPASARRSRRLASVRLENLEGRLALSSFSAGGFVPLIKHGALPTAVQVQPMIIGNHIGTNSIQGNHIGTNSIQGNHIGTNSIQGNHIGTNAMQAQDDKVKHGGISHMSTKFTVELGVAAESVLPKKTIEAVSIQGMPGADAVATTIMRKH